MRKGGTLVGTAGTAGVTGRYGCFRPDPFGGTVRRRPAHPTSRRQGCHGCRAAKIGHRYAARGSHTPNPNGRQFGRRVGDTNGSCHGQVLKKVSYFFSNVMLSKCRRC